MRKLILSFAGLLLCLCHCGPAQDSGKAAPPKPVRAPTWQAVSAGIEFGTLAAPHAEDGDMHIVRIDPAKVELILLSASAEGHEPLTADQWAKRHGLIAVTNAGMFDVDHDTHVGYMKRGDAVKPADVRKDYSSAAAFAPAEASKPSFRMFDLDDGVDLLKDISPHYGLVIQNLRLIKRPGENRWQQQPRQWSEAALGEDKDGKVLFIFSRAPASMHDFNHHLLKQPIDLVCAQHLEGGPEASLYLKVGGVVFQGMGSFETGFNENDDNRVFWPLPNVIGVRERSPAK